MSDPCPPVAVPVVVASQCPPAELPLPALPPVNAECYAPPPVAPGVNTCRQVQLPDELKVVQSDDADCQTVVRENNNYTTFNKTVVTQVNRNHLHTQESSQTKINTTHTLQTT